MIPKGEKEAWLNIVEPSDLDIHMANIGQAETNAKIVKDFFEKFSLSNGSKILIHGCGTCQVFDYITPSDLGNVEMTFVDISQKMLDVAKHRLRKFNGLSYRTLVDDIENTGIRENYDAVLLILILLHTDWRRSLENMIKLKPSSIYIIEQEQTSGSAVTKERTLPASIQRYAELAVPELIPFRELAEFLDKKGYKLVYTTERAVPDNKVMAGLIFAR